jgi:hypothetical protein
MLGTAIRIFLAMVVAAAVSSLIVRMTSEPVAASVVGDLILVAGVALGASRGKAEPLTLLRSLGAGITAILCVLLIVLAGLALSDKVTGYLEVATSIFWLGYYPSGADVPFNVGAFLWAASIAGLLGLGEVLGRLARGRNDGGSALIRRGWDA